MTNDADFGHGSFRDGGAECAGGGRESREGSAKGEHFAALSLGYWNSSGRIEYMGT